ncbi:MAG: hypothetical protein J2P38_05855 [Candidatus Dormibacteraeota bacterium]|nr:hypothetical protein [Candidatus Dormibacteraeota bacterium]
MTYLPYLVLFAALGLFAYQNQVPTNISFAVWHFLSIPLWWPVVAAGVAFLAVALIRDPSWRRR